MSEACPEGALDALLARTVSFRGKPVALTLGALLALESLSARERASESFAAWTLVCVSSAEGDEIPRVLGALRSEAGVLPHVLAWAAEIGKEARSEAVSVADVMLDAYCSSRCAYNDGSGRPPERVECGNAVALAGFFMREYRMSFLEFFALPATRANALYAAWCEAKGLAGQDTFWSREMLRGAEKILAGMDFSWAEKKKNKTEN